MSGIRITKATGVVPVAGQWLWWADAFGRRLGVWAVSAGQAEEAAAKMLGIKTEAKS